MNLRPRRIFGFVFMASLLAMPCLSAAQPATAPAAEQQRWFAPTAAPQVVTIGSLQAAPDGKTPAYAMAVELTNQGASVLTVKLSDYFASVADKKLHAKDPQAYERAVQAEPQKYGGHYSLLNPVGRADKRQLPLATRRLSLSAADRQMELTMADLDKRYWSLDSHDETSATFGYTVLSGPSREQSAPVLRLTKTYRLQPRDYSLSVSLHVENLSAGELLVELDQAGPTGLPREDVRSDMRQAAYGKLNVENSKVQVSLKSHGELQKMRLGGQVGLGSSDDQNNPVLWVGHVNKFFGSMMYLRPAEQGKLAAAASAARFYVRAVEETPTSRTFAAGLVLPAISLPPGESRQFDLDVYAGPKKRDIFTDGANPYFKPLYKSLDYVGVIDFGTCFCTFNWLSLAMMWLLDKLSVVALGNYGVAIILLVAIVRLVLHPLTKKSQVNMMKMQKLGPQMQKLKEKYADDKAALNREMMKFYRQQGATPLLGCLPMLLQMPILIALYQGINASVELRHAAFLPVWITDLSAPDRLLSWQGSFPLIGNSLNLLPILLAVAMYFQTKMTPQMGQAAAMSEQQAAQQKMMKYMMPAMMLIFFYSLASGLTLYFMASTAAGVIEQVVIRKHMQARQAQAAAEETTIEMPGKPARSARGKKPKGPTWFKH